MAAMYLRPKLKVLPGLMQMRTSPARIFDAWTRVIGVGCIPCQNRKVAPRIGPFMSTSIFLRSTAR